jgi:hypothetical protein
MRFAVGADGVARDVRVHAKPEVDPAFAQAGRAMVGDFIFPPTRPKEVFEMVIDFSPKGEVRTARYEDSPELMLNRLPDAERRQMLTNLKWLAEGYRR